MALYFFDRETLVRLSVKIPEEYKEYLKEHGKGSYTKGIILLIQDAKDKSTKRKKKTGELK